MNKPCELNLDTRNVTNETRWYSSETTIRNLKFLIQSETALNAGETENYWVDQLEAIHQREHKDAWYFWIPEQVPDEDFSIKKEKNCANIGTRFSTAMLFKSQDWYSTDHGSHTPLQDEGDETMMDLVTGLQTRCEHKDPM